MHSTWKIILAALKIDFELPLCSMLHACANGVTPFQSRSVLHAPFCSPAIGTTFSLQNIWENNNIESLIPWLTVLFVLFYFHFLKICQIVRGMPPLSLSIFQDTGFKQFFFNFNFLNQITKLDPRISTIWYKIGHWLQDSLNNFCPWNQEHWRQKDHVLSPSLWLKHKWSSPSRKINTLPMFSHRGSKGWRLYSKPYDITTISRTINSTPPPT